MTKGTYIASRASIPERAQAWKALRAEGYLIVSSWIDGQVEADFEELWSRIEGEVTNAERLIVYVEPEDFPLKGTLVEVGMALAAKVPVYVVAPGVQIEKDTFRPIGSWINHPLVTLVSSMKEALKGADKKIF